MEDYEFHFDKDNFVFTPDSSSTELKNDAIIVQDQGCAISGI